MVLTVLLWIASLVVLPFLCGSGMGLICQKSKEFHNIASFDELYHLKWPSFSSRKEIVLSLKVNELKLKVEVYVELSMAVTISYFFSSPSIQPTRIYNSNIFERHFSGMFL